MKPSLPQPPSSVRTPLRGIVVAGLAITLLATGAQADGNTAAEILKMTGGARVRIVWSRWAGNEQVIPGKDTTIYNIVAFDTSDGRERMLATDTRCKHPMITPNGKRVITDDLTLAFRDETKGLPQKIYVMDWTGGKRRELCSGFKAVGVCEDPPGTEWVMVLDVNNGKVWRHQIDNPSVRELVWDKTPGSWFWAFTRDGKRACTGAPWPNVCVVQLPNGSVSPVGGGCAEGIAPDGKHCFHFIQDHAGVMMHDGPGAPDCQ